MDRLSRDTSRTITRSTFETGRVSLIDDEDEYQIYVGLDDGDVEVLETFIEALETGDRHALEQHKAPMYERVVSARESRIDTDALQLAAGDSATDDVLLIDEDRRLFAITGTAATTWYDGMAGLQLQ